MLSSHTGNKAMSNCDPGLFLHGCVIDVVGERAKRNATLNSSGEEKQNKTKQNKTSGLSTNKGTEEEGTGAKEGN